jgi:hypothetical protein
MRWRPRRRASLGARTTRQASVTEGGVFCWPRNQPEPSRSDPIGGGTRAGSSSGLGVLLPAPIRPRSWEVDNASFAQTAFSRKFVPLTVRGELGGLTETPAEVLYPLLGPRLPAPA